MVVGIIIALIVLLATLIFVIDRQKPDEKLIPRDSPVGIEKLRTVKSLDSLYAESNGMWVCRYCETLNHSGSSSCAACGENDRTEENL